MGDKLYCGMDFHKNVTELCVVDERGKIVDRARMKTELLTKYLANKKHYHIGVEASGGVFDVTEKLEKCGHTVTIINPARFRGIGIGGKKNDRNDAEALATALRLGFVPEVHKKTLYSRQIKSLLMSRDIAVRTRVGLVNHVRGIMREYGLPIPQGTTAFWEQVSGRLEEIECSIVRGLLGSLAEQAARFKDIESEAEKSLENLTSEDERILRLREVPGVGLITASAFVAAVDDPTRFRDSKRLGSYLGLTPRENSSGNKTRFGGITKCGPELVRRSLIHGARAVFRYAATPENKIRTWAARLEVRAGTNKTVVALAHKNARIMYAMLRDGTRFGEKKVRQTPQAKAA